MAITAIQGRTEREKAKLLVQSKRPSNIGLGKAISDHLGLCAESTATPEMAEGGTCALQAKTLEAAVDPRAPERASLSDKLFCPRMSHLPMLSRHVARCSLPMSACIRTAVASGPQRRNRSSAMTMS
jgi:hypothetical protein